MARYQVTGFKAQFPAGFVLSLTAEQAKPRSHNLKDLKQGRFEVINPVEFKKGEVVAVIKGQVAKGSLGLLTEIEDKKAADKA